VRDHDEHQGEPGSWGALERMRERVRQMKEAERAAAPLAPESAPRLGRQAVRILAHLRHEGGITALEAITRYGIGRLAAVVFNLRAAGYPIETETVEVRKADGTTAKIARYWLVQS
jgi:hypothetical protein